MKPALTDPSRTGLYRRQHGLTLIELIIAIVVLGIAAVAITATLSRSTVFNTDPLLRVQSLALAESYLEEVLARPFYQPEGNPLVDTEIEPGGETICPNTLPSPNDPRTQWSVCDYKGLNLTSPTQPDGDPLPGLDGYSAAFQVSPSDFGDLPSTGCGLKITVTVTPPSGDDLSLTGYRTSYWEDC